MPEPRPSEQYSLTRPVVFFVSGEPVPKARPRVTRHGTYTPERVKAWEDMVAITYRATGREVFAGPVGVVLRFYRQSNRRADIDNLVKAVLDGLNGIAWHDDGQVKFLMADIQHCDGDDVGVQIKIEPRA